MLLLLSLFLLTSVTLADSHTKLRNVPASECGVCHQEIYSQWKGSMHAQSTALKDPIHRAFYNAVIGPEDKEGVKKKGKYPVCLQCHAPGAAKDGKTDLTSSPVYADGVSCVSCHSFTRFKGTKKPGGGLRLGLAAYEYTDDALQGPSGRTIHPEIDAQGRLAPMFKVEGNQSMLKTNAVCMGCHDQRKNFNKVALCNTGGEIASAPGGQDCQLCHMPVTNGVVDHSFMGGHNHKMVAKGLTFTMEVIQGKDKQRVASVTLKNKLPHNFPTGAPFRNVYVVVRAYDSGGIEVWKSTKSHPIKDDMKSMLMYKLGDDTNKPAPPPKATKVLGDSRLKPYETRVIDYPLPAGDIKQVKAEVFYDLLLPGNKKKFADKIPANLKQAKLIATAVTDL